MSDQSWSTDCHRIPGWESSRCCPSCHADAELGYEPLAVTVGSEHLFVCCAARQFIDQFDVGRLKPKKVVVYIAGPYRDERGEYYVHENIRQAEALAAKVWQAGMVALCPHLNTRFFGGLEGTTDATWLTGDLELLSRCDAVLLTDHWWQSSGAVAEHKFALQHGIPVFDDIELLIIYFGGQSADS